MGDALPNTDSPPEYLEYFGLGRAPFTRINNPSELFLAEQYSYISAHLADATEEFDRLVVICGHPGSGKTSLLSKFSKTALEQICVATIADNLQNPESLFASILAQFGFGEISGTPEQLRNILSEFLKQQGQAGDPVILLVDNAHLLHPKVFEQLRWMTSIHYKGQPIVNLVLAGCNDLRKIMDSPAMSQITAKHHVRFNIRAYTEEETANYIWHRLQLAGGRQCVQFTDEAHSLIYRYTGGTPRFINVLCGNAMQVVYTKQRQSITGEIVRHIADQNKLVPHVVPVQNKCRRKTDPDFKAATDEIDTAKPRPTNKAGAPAAKPDAGQGKANTKSAARKVGKKANGARGKSTAGKAANTLPDLALAEDLTILEKIATLSEQLGNLKARKKDLEMEVNHRDQAIASLEVRLEDEQRTNQDLLKKLEANVVAAEESRKVLAKTSYELKKNQDEISSLTTGLSQLREELQQEAESKASVSKQLDLARAEAKEKGAQAILVEGLQKTLGERDLRINELQSALLDRDGEILEFKFKVQESDLQIGALEKQAENASALQRKVEALTEKMDALGSQLEQKDQEIAELQTAALEASQAEAAGAAEAESARIQELETALASATKAREELTNQLAEGNTENQRLAQEIEQLAAQVESTTAADAEARISSLAEEVSGRDQQLARLDAAIAKSSDENEWLRCELERRSEVDEQLATATIDHEKTRVALDSTKLELRDAKQAMAELEGKLEASRLEVDQLAPLKRELTAAEKLVTRHEARLARIEDKSSTQKADLAAARSELRKLRKQLKAAEKTQAKLDKQVNLNKELTSNLDERSQEIAELRDAMAKQASQQDANAASLAELKAMQPELENLKNSAGDIDKEMAAYQAIEDAISSQLETSEALSSSLQEQLAQLLSEQSELAQALQPDQNPDEQVERAQAENAKLAEQLSEKDALLEQLGEQLRDAEVMRETAGHSDEKHAELLEELEATRRRLTTMQQEFAREAEQNHELQSQLLDYSDIQDQLGEQLLLMRELEAKLSVAEQERDALLAEPQMPGKELQQGAAMSEPPARRSDPEKFADGSMLTLMLDKKPVMQPIRTEYGAKLIIGRAEDNDIFIDSEFVSRHHALLFSNEKGLWIEDLNSTNGTLVNGQKFGTCQLDDGDLVSIGEYEIKVATAEIK